MEVTPTTAGSKLVIYLVNSRWLNFSEDSRVDFPSRSRSKIRTSWPEERNQEASVHSPSGGVTSRPGCNGGCARRTLIKARLLRLPLLMVRRLDSRLTLD